MRKSFERLFGLVRDRLSCDPLSPSPSPPPRSEADRTADEGTGVVPIENQALEERLRLELIRKYGPKSEKLGDNQLQLLDLKPGVSTEEVEAESRRESLPAASRGAAHRGLFSVLSAKRSQAEESGTHDGTGLGSKLGWPLLLVPGAESALESLVDPVPASFGSPSHRSRTTHPVCNRNTARD